MTPAEKAKGCMEMQVSLQKHLEEIGVPPELLSSWIGGYAATFDLGLGVGSLSATASGVASKSPPAPEPKRKKLTKTSFILSFDPQTTAKEIIKEAKAFGMGLTPKMVYSVRSAHRKSQKKGSAKKKAAQKKASAKKKPSNGASAAAAEGRRQVALGLRPSLRVSMVKVLAGSKKPMNAGDMVEALEKRGWCPQGKDPRGYVLYMFSKKPETFKRTDRGVYELQPGVVVPDEPEAAKPKEPTKPKAKAEPAPALPGLRHCLALMLEKPQPLDLIQNAFEGLTINGKGVTKQEVAKCLKSNTGSWFQKAGNVWSRASSSSRWTKGRKMPKALQPLVSSAN